jgi:hypothetical protein
MDVFALLLFSFRRMHAIRLLVGSQAWERIVPAPGSSRDRTSPPPLLLPCTSLPAPAALHVVTHAEIARRRRHG